VTLPEGYPCVISDEQITADVREQALAYLGETRVSAFPKRMTADDFGFFTQHYPCCYYRFGVAREGQKPGALHSGTFLIDEKSLLSAAGLFTFIVLNSLK